jgi:hypothetical protein
MPRKFVPVHLRKHGPGTAGRNKERDVKICRRRRAGISFDKLGVEFKLSRERVRKIVRASERAVASNERTRIKWRGVFANTRPAGT